MMMIEKIKSYLKMMSKEHKDEFFNKFGKTYNVYKKENGSIMFSIFASIANSFMYVFGFVLLFFIANKEVIGDSYVETILGVDYIFFAIIKAFFVIFALFIVIEVIYILAFKILVNKFLKERNYDIKELELEIKKMKEDRE